MEASVLTIYTDDIVREIAARFGVMPASFTPLGDFENFVYEFQYQGKPHILRVSHQSHRTEAQILAELDWVAYLAENDVPVAAAVVSPTERLVEVVNAGNEQFFAVCFPKATGKPVNRESGTGWHNGLFQEWGRITGRIHKLTQEYEMPAQYKRHHWHEDPYVRNFSDYVPAKDDDIRRIWFALLERLHQLPISKDNYGLVHSDFHYGNFVVDKEKITFFDTDDCNYHWFAADIAIILFYSLHWAKKTTSKAEIKIFLTHFLKGYEQENKFYSGWVTHFPDFLKLRQMLLYAVIHLKWEFFEALPAERKQWLYGMRQQILDEIPVLSFDFRGFRAR